MPSLSKMRNRYFLIVCSLRLSSRAVSRLLRPSATRATTCSSRGVRSWRRVELSTRSEGTTDINRTGRDAELRAPAQGAGEKLRLHAVGVRNQDGDCG